MNSVIETYTGKYFDYADPRPYQVCVEDIARALSNAPRFGGHTSQPLSVAQHAVLVSWLVGGDARLQLAALHHDSHEAYLGDIPTPLKHELGNAYAALRFKADVAIAGKLGIDQSLFTCREVHQADELALRIEAAHLKESRGLGEHWGRDSIPPLAPMLAPHRLTPQEAERNFLRCHAELTAASA